MPDKCAYVDRVASFTCKSVEEKRSENQIAEDDSVQSKILDVAPSLGEGAGKVISLLLWGAAVGASSSASAWMLCAGIYEMLQYSTSCCANLAGYAFFLSPNQTPGELS